MAITDNTAKWQVKKVTNFTDKSAEIATQAQAEEGVDNTKVMTPLRAKQLGDKNYLTVNGGILNGAINCKYADAIAGLTSSGYVNISGGNNYLSGANITLYGKDHPINAGVFALSCNGAKALIGFPHGELFWDGKKVATFNSSGHLELPDGSEFWIA